MPEYLHPGVYIEETSYRGKPIQGVSTSTAGFVGAARKGPEGKAVFIPNYGHFRRTFGDPISPVRAPGDYLGHAVKAFFDNGGARCYVVRSLAGDASGSAAQLEQGTALSLAPGVTVRGPTDTIRLNALRGVGVDSVLRVFTRSDSTSNFTETRSIRVASYDAVRGSVTAVPGDVIPSGVVLEPSHTVILVTGAAPGSATHTGGGATFTARHRGEDGDRIAVQVRPVDRPPVALVTTSASRSDPLLDIEATSFPLAVGETNLQFTVPSLRLLRVGDELGVGSSVDLFVQAIAPGDVAFDVVGGGAGNNFTAASVIRLIERDGVTFGTPFELGVAPAAFAIDMTAGGPFGPAPLLHDLAALLRVGDVVQVDDAGVTTDVSVTAVRVAEEIAPGAHVTLAAGLASAEAGPVETWLTNATDADLTHTRLFVGDAAGFEVPARTGSAEGVAVTDGANVDAGRVMLVEPATNTLFIARAAGEFPATADLANWTGVEALQVAQDGATSVRVAGTAGFYSGAKVELDTGTQKIERIVQSVDAGARTVTFTAGLPLGPGVTIDVPSAPDARNVYLRTCEIDILVYEDGEVVESFEALSWNPDPVSDAGLRYFVDRINDEEVGSKLIKAEAAAAAGLGFAQAPVSADGQPRSLTGGSNGSPLTPAALIGDDNGPGRRTGIQALSERDDISMVAVPGVTDEAVQSQLITHCELLRYRMAVLDSPQNARDVTEVQSHRNNYDSKYAAYYSPWLKALNLSNGRSEVFPPSGHVMGIYARSDNTVGVHKAPANEPVRNITDVDLPFTASEQDVLNPIGVNLIRDLKPRGIRVWGARTISSDQEWKYLNIRRLFIYLEHSIDLGTQWVVFEPNSEELWERVVSTIRSFLVGVWKTGALMGTTPEEAFFVNCNRSTMSQTDIDNGRLICEIGVAPVAPAEFVIFKIGQATLAKES